MLVEVSLAICSTQIYIYSYTPFWLPAKQFEPLFIQTRLAILFRYYLFKVEHTYKSTFLLRSRYAVKLQVYTLVTKKYYMYTI